MFTTGTALIVNYIFGQKRCDNQKRRMSEKISECNYGVELPLTIEENHEYDLLYKAYTSLRGNKNRAYQLFGITSRLCEMCILNDKFWNTRIKMIKELYKNFFWHSLKCKSKFMNEYEKIALRQAEYYNIFTYVRKERKPDFIKMELSWIQKCLYIHHKNFQIWHYIGVFTELVDLAPKKLPFFMAVFAKEPRNIHLWTFLLKFVVRRKDFDFGMEFTKQVILADGTNNSAYSLRLTVVKLKYVKNKDIIQQEVSLFKNGIVQDKNIAVTNYLFGLNKICNIEHTLFEMYQTTRYFEFKYKFIIFCLGNKRRHFYALCCKFEEDYVEPDNLKKQLLSQLMCKIQE